MLNQFIRLTSITLFIFIIQTGYSQNNHLSSPSFGAQIAVPFIYEKLPEGLEYQPFMLMAHYNFKNLLPKRKSNLWIYTEPQLVLVNYKPDAPKDFEFGANLGFQLQLPLSSNIFWLAAIGSGPHYASVETSMQAKGFIFSDNFECGFLFQQKKGQLEFNLKTRFRHISNAGLNSLNLGIDNWFIIFGISKRS